MAVSNVEMRARISSQCLVKESRSCQLLEFIPSHDLASGVSRIFMERLLRGRLKGHKCCENLTMGQDMLHRVK